MHANKLDKESQNISPGKNILEDFVVKKYDKASYANITDKSPHKKARNKNTSNRR